MRSKYFTAKLFHARSAFHKSVRIYFIEKTEDSIRIFRFFWRRGWDSNSRRLAPHNISNVAPSTTRPPLQIDNKTIITQTSEYVKFFYLMVCLLESCKTKWLKNWNIFIMPPFGVFVGYRKYENRKMSDNVKVNLHYRSFYIC